MAQPSRQVISRIAGGRTAGHQPYDHRAGVANPPDYQVLALPASGRCSRLAMLLDEHGSDKTFNGYASVYDVILAGRPLDSVRGVQF